MELVPVECYGKFSYFWRVFNLSLINNNDDFFLALKGVFAKN